MFFVIVKQDERDSDKKPRPWLKGISHQLCAASFPSAVIGSELEAVQVHRGKD